MTDLVWEIAGAIIFVGLFRLVVLAFTGFDPFVINVHHSKEGDDD